MSVNSNTSQALKQNYLTEYTSLLHSFSGSNITLAKREFSESVQAALSCGLAPSDLQKILDSVLGSGFSAKEVQ